MLVRFLEPNELNSLLALYQHLHASDDPLPSPSAVARVWDELTSNPRYRLIGGFIDGQLVSTCTLTIVPNLTRGCRSYGIIENVVTHAGHRKRGYGKAVLKEALRQAWAAHCYKVMLLTGRKDSATLRFYENAGFDPQAKQAFVAKPKDG